MQWPLYLAAVAAAAAITLFGWPGLTILPPAFIGIRLSATPPSMDGRDPWGQRCADRPGLQAAYERARAWGTRPGEWFAGPFCLIAAGASCALAWNQSVWWGAPLQILGGALTGLMIDVTVRAPAGAPIRTSPVVWPKDRRLMILAGVAGLPPAVIAAAITHDPATALACPLLAAGITGWWPGFRSNRRRAGDGKAAWNRLMERLASTAGKPPVPRPRAISSTTRMGDALRVRVVAGDGGARPWLEAKTVSTLADTPGPTLAISPVAGRRDQVDLIELAETPDGPQEDDKAMQAALTWELNRACILWNKPMGRIDRLTRISQPQSPRPAWRFRIDGAEDPAVIGRDWLQGRPDDLGRGIGMTVIQSGQDYWLLPDDWEHTVRFDDHKALDGTDTSISSSPDASSRIRLILRYRSDRDVWERALPAKLPQPLEKLDTETTVASPDGWALNLMETTIPSGAATVSDYIKAGPYLAAWGDAYVADMLPRLRPRGGWSTRRMRFIRDLRALEGRRLPAPPDTLDGLRGSDPASALLAQVLVSRALAGLLKAPALVADARQCAGTGDWSLWTLRLETPAGIIPADIARAHARLAGALGVDFLLAEWTDNTHLMLWAGDRPPLEPAQADQWARPADQKRLIPRILDRAWSDAGVVAGGDPPRCTGLKAAPGGLIQADFAMPAGLSATEAMDRIDRFRTAGGYQYARQLDSGDPSTLILLLGVHEPLPRAADADWKAMADRAHTRVIPFGVRDDASTAVLDPSVSPHLLIAGVTGFGKSSAGQVILSSMALKGWDLIVADPSKGANDFLPLKRVSLAFATDLPHTEAALAWAAGEMRRRVRLLAEYKVGNIRELPEDVRPPMLGVAVDEFNSLCATPDRQRPNPGSDPTIANLNLRIMEENRSRAAVGGYVCDIAAQGRSAGLVLILMAQALKADELGALPAAGTLKRNLARLFLGNGSPAGTISPNNIRDANRLIRGFGDMPKGRGVMEDTGRGVRGVQCWWSGGTGLMAERLSALPDREPLDLTGLMPAPPRQVGVSRATPEEVETQAVDGFDWSALGA